MSVTIFRRNRVNARIGSLMHSIIALAFLIVPTVMFGYFLMTIASSGVSAAQESVANAEIAKHPVRSQHGVLFDEGIISITFDDGWKSVATNAAPIMGEYRMVSTQYIITDYIGAKEYMSLGQIKALKDAGHEIGSHSASHVAIADEDDASMAHEFIDSKSKLEALKLVEKDVRLNFAYPYGSKSARTNEFGKSHYYSLRGVSSFADGFNDYDFNHRETFSRSERFTGVTIEKDTSLSQIKHALQYAKTNKAWLVINFHQIDDKNTEYSVSPKMFRNILLAVQDANIKTMTVSDALASFEEK